MPKLPVPSRFQSFEILEELPTGLSGHVYKARYKDGSIVVIKFFDHRTDNERGRTIFGYFSNEQLLLREVFQHRQHPHIVEYVVSNLTRPPYFLVTRYVEGARSLSELVDQPLSPGFVLQVVQQVGSALDYLHYGHPSYSPIIHRDVKPGNVLLDVAGNAVLIDLSIARHPAYALEDESGLGSPPYMPPEQYLGEEVPATDQFALAALALRMLVGRSLLPEKAGKAREKLEALRDNGYAEVQKQLGERTHTAEAIIKAMAHNPAERYANCEEFAHNLHRAFIKDDLPLEDTAPPVERARFPLAALAMVVVGIVAVVALVLALNSGSTVAGEPTVMSVPAATGPTATLQGAVENGAGSPDSAPGLPGRAATATLAPTVTPIEFTPTPVISRVRVVGTRELLREQPSTDARTLAVMPVGVEAQRTGQRQQIGPTVWHQVIYENQTGWCRNEYCQPQ
jgi:hypothetical protein